VTVPFADTHHLKRIMNMSMALSQGNNAFAVVLENIRRPRILNALAIEQNSPRSIGMSPEIHVRERLLTEPLQSKMISGLMPRIAASVLFDGQRIQDNADVVCFPKLPRSVVSLAEGHRQYSLSA